MIRYKKVDPGYMLIDMVSCLLRKEPQRRYFWKDSEDRMHEIKTVDLNFRQIICVDGTLIGLDEANELYLLEDD